MKNQHDNWDAHWDRYAASASLNPAQEMRHREILTRLRAIKLPIERLLDAGSGQGDFLQKADASQIAKSYVGLELSESGVYISRQKVPGATFLPVDLFAPSPAAGAYVGWATVAVCSDVIEHVDDPVGFLRALRQYLADDALLVLTVPGGPMSKFDHHIGHRRHYDKHSVRQVLTEAGYHVERIALCGFPFFNVYRLFVILRGNRLISDVEATEGHGTTSSLARIVMAIFGLLFRANLSNFPLGWQVLAIARKK